MKEKFNKLIDRYGYKELFLIAFYPIFLPLFMIKDTSLSIYNIIKALLKYNWKYLSGNDQKNAYNNLFYYIQDYNIQKFGRYGRSNLLAGGDFSLKNWFHTTPFSLRMQASFGTTFIMFFSMCFWLLSWVVLYQDNPNLWILGVVFFSSLFFATFIEIQNYNILGWMLYPIFLTYIESADYLVLTIVLFLIALSSFTAFFIAGILVVVSSIYLSDYYLLFILIPGGIKLIMPVIVSMKDGALTKIIGALGGHEKVKYSRIKYKKLNIAKFYTLGLQLQFVIFSLLLDSLNFPIVLLFLIIVLFMVNELFMRFADQQSFYLAYLSVSVFYLLNIDLNISLALSFILSIYPIYGFIMNVAPRGQSFIAPSIRKPYDVKKDIDGLMKLFDQVPNNEKILVAYRNPEGQYSNIFNGYRTFNEPIQYAATIKNICLFPDWHMVFENNKENDDESFWINSESEALKYMNEYKIKYILILDLFIENRKLFNVIKKFEFTSFDSLLKSFEIKLLKIGNK